MARRRPPTVHGIAVVDKPAGVTSHDVVGMLRRRFDERRVGHAGTLDPSATGVLVVGFGSVTRLLRFVVDGRKSYVGEVVVGIETDSLDADGVVTATHEPIEVDIDTVRRVVAEHLTGDIEQVPPMVSALKVDGKRLHELAREGIEVERKPRPITVHRFEVSPTDDPLVWRCEVDCSSGTYIRSLAADLGTALGGGAHLRALRRTRSGTFGLDEAIPLEAASVDGLLPPVEALRHLPLLSVDDHLVAAIGHGKVLPLELLGATGEGPWRIAGPAGDLLAVYETHREGTAKPAVVLAGA
jgi:tRNA pseudouridine55 synthase